MGFFNNARQQRAPWLLPQMAGVVSETGATQRPIGGTQPAGETVQGAYATRERDPLAPRPEQPEQQQAPFVLPHPQQQQQPQYREHYSLHGRDEHGRMPEMHKKRSGLQKFGKVLGDGLLYLAAGNGSPQAMARLRERGEAKQERRRAEAQFQDHDRIMGAMMRQGMTADQAEIAALNLEKFSDHYTSRYKADVINKGDTRYSPNLNGTADTYTAPETFKEGADVGATPPIQGRIGAAYGAPSPIGSARSFDMLRPEPEQYADSIAPRGSDEWLQAVQDAEMGANGPTANAYRQSMLTQRLATQERNNIRTNNRPRGSTTRAPAPKAPTPTSVIGRIMDKQARGQALTPGEQSTYNDYRAGKGSGNGRRGGSSATAVGPNGEQAVLRNGKWVDARTGRPL